MRKTQLTYDQVSKLIKEKYGIDYETIAYEMDERGFLK
jgi:hypothetical protein